MNLKHIHLVNLIILLTLSGCATIGTSTALYIAPNEPRTPKNEIIVNKKFDLVWDYLVMKLSGSFFVINNIDKESRLINISFSTNKPEVYIDCGSARRIYNFQNDAKEYSYKVASGSSYKSTGLWGPYRNLPSVYNINRKTALEGRINIYVAPMMENETKVAVNVRYIFTSNVSGFVTGYNAFGQLVRQDQLPAKTSSSSFNTNEISKENWGNAENPEYITCKAIGVLENELLSMADIK